MMSGNAIFYASSSVTGQKSQFSPSVTINVDNTVPEMAVADSILLRSASGSLKASEIEYWRVRTPQESINGKDYSFDIDVPFNNSTNLGPIREFFNVGDLLEYL